MGGGRRSYGRRAPRGRAAGGHGPRGYPGEMAAGRGDCLHVGAEEDVDPPCATVRIRASRRPLVAGRGEDTTPRGHARDPPCEGRARADPRELLPPLREGETGAIDGIRSEPVPVPEPGAGHAGTPRDRLCGPRVPWGSP